MLIIKSTNGAVTEIKNADSGKVLVSILSKREDDKIILLIAGSIKTPVAAEFSETIMEYLKQTRVLILDIKAVEYIASAGLRALLTAQQYVDDSDDDINMIIRNTNDEVMDVFETTGFDNILNIEK